GTVPLGFTASPDCPSEAMIVAFAEVPKTAVEGQLTSTLGGLASTCTLRVPGDEVLPALSLTVPDASWAPSVLNFCGAGTADGSTPLPGLPSDSAGSPFSVNDT